MTGGIDFEAEGLRGDLSGEAREDRLALLQELAAQNGAHARFENRR
jgi:hypothetical protein